MTFTLQQTSLTASGTTSGGTTYLQAVLPALSTAGRLLVATMQTANGGVPFKCAGLATAPGNVAAAAVGSGGTFTAGTYFWKITCTTAAGETTGSAEVSATLVLNGSANLTWGTLPAWVTGVKVYRGTAANGEDHLIATLGRVTSYTDTGTTGSVNSPPGANTAAVPNTSPGWVFCGLAAAGTVLQAEIWAYPNNPGGLSGACFTNAAGAACRGSMQEWSSTKQWQVMDLFPGAGAATGTGQPTGATNGTPGTGDLAVALLADHFTAAPTSQSWTAPSGWTLINSQANSLATPWAAYYKISTGAGAVTITGNYSTSVNQDARAAVVVAFREADSVAAPVGCSVSGSTYNDQDTINPAQAYPKNHTGSMKEVDFFIGRQFAQAAGVQYQQEGDTVGSVPGGMADITAAGGQVCWVTRPARALTGAALTAEQAKLDSNIAVIRQGGVTGFIMTLWNEHNYGGQNGPFGNDTTSPKPPNVDPYGTGNTDASAKSNWLAYWGNYQPVCASHGIPVYAKPLMSSPKAASSWTPPAGTISGVVIDYYYGDYKGQYTLDTSPAAGIPSIADICDGIKNPDNSNASNTPIPLGIGEGGRAGGGSSTTPWATVTSWWSAHIRGFFKTRLAAGKQNAPVIWFENTGPPTPGPNWLHTPGANGEDQASIQAQLRRTVDDLTVSVVTGGNPVITTTSPLPPGQQGVPYSASLTAAGGTTPYTWAVTTGALPAGLTLNAVTGQITGSPSVTGVFSTGFTVTDAAALTGTATLSLTITAITALAIPAQTLPQGTVSQAYSTAVTATGGTQPYTAWAITAGSLPAGLTLSATAGTINGTPSGAGTSAFTVQVTDHAAATASRALSITVTAAALGVQTVSLPPATQNLAYSAQLTAAAGTAPYTWAVISGSLPPGLALTTSNNNGVISGIPAVTGTYPFTAQVTDNTAATASVNLTITVTAVTVAVPPSRWRLLLAAPQPDGTYLAEIAQAQNRALTLRTEPDQASETSFDILGDTGPGAQILELETDIHVMYGTELLYAGRVGATQDSITAAGYYLNVTSADYREVLRRRAILPGDTLSFTGTEQALIAWNLLNASQGRPGGGLGIARGAGQNTGINRTMTFANGDYIGDRITQMAQLTGGFEWQITPYKQSDLRLDVFYPQQGTNRGVVLSPGDGRVTSITRATDPSAFANAIYETASGLTAQFVESGTVAEGRWDKVIGSDLKTSSALADDATAQLAAAQVLVPAYTIVLRPGSWGGPSDIWMGDTVTVQIRAGRLDVNDQLRVAEMQFAISADGQETLTLTVGMLPLNLFKKIPAILKRLRYLETR